MQMKVVPWLAPDCRKLSDNLLTGFFSNSFLSGLEIVLEVGLKPLLN